MLLMLMLHMVCYHTVWLPKSVVNLYLHEKKTLLIKMLEFILTSDIRGVAMVTCYMY